MASYDPVDPIVSILPDGESLTIIEMVEGKPDEPPRNVIKYSRIEDYFIRTHTNYYGHEVKDEVSGEEADYEVNGYLTFEGYTIESKT